MISSKPRTKNDRLLPFFSSPLLLVLFITTLASTTALANAIRFPPSSSPSSSSSSSSSPTPAETPDAKTANPLTGSRYPEYPPRDPPNTVYLVIEVATTDQPSPRATINLIEKVFLLDYEQVEGESEDTDLSPVSFRSSVGNGFDSDVAADDYGNFVDNGENGRSGRDGSDPIIRIGKISFRRTRAIFETSLLLNPPEGTTCTLDEVDDQESKDLGRFQTVDRMRDQSDVMPNIIPSKYKPLIKLATGVTCIQRQV